MIVFVLPVFARLSRPQISKANFRNSTCQTERKMKLMMLATTNQANTEAQKKY